MHDFINGPTDPLFDVAVTLDGSVPEFDIQAGELVAQVSDAAITAADFTWDTDLATTREAFVAAFLGVSKDRSLAGDTDDRSLVIAIEQDGNFFVDLAAADTVAIGEYLGPAKDTGNALVNACEVVADKDNACFVVVKAETTSTTRVRARLINTTIKK